jgi:hypothetical protein
MEGCPYRIRGGTNSSHLAKRGVSEVSSPFLEGRESEGRRFIKKYFHIAPIMEGLGGKGG